jgi:hypothetical protein
MSEVKKPRDKDYREVESLSFAKGARYSIN